VVGGERARCKVPSVRDERTRTPLQVRVAPQEMPPKDTVRGWMTILYLYNSVGTSVRGRFLNDTLLDDVHVYKTFFFFFQEYRIIMLCVILSFVL